MGRWEIEGEKPKSVYRNGVVGARRDDERASLRALSASGRAVGSYPRMEMEEWRNATYKDYGGCVSSCTRFRGEHSALRG